METYDLSPAFSRVSSSKLLDLLTVCRTWSTTSDPCGPKQEACDRRFQTDGEYGRGSGKQTVIRCFRVGKFYARGAVSDCHGDIYVALERF